jgi:tetratricopeptide (TPR) repeat protein
LNTKFFDVYSLRGVTQYILEDYEGAIKDFTKSISSKTYHKIIKTEIGQPIDYDYYNRGNCKSILNDSEGAIEDYTKAIEIVTEMRTAKIGTISPIENYYSSRGDQKNNLGQYFEAIEDYTSAIEFEQSQSIKSTIYYKRGLVKDKIRDNVGAIADYDKSKNLDPNSVPPLEDISSRKVIIENPFYLANLKFIIKKKL